MISLDGQKIRRVKRFKLYCRACSKLNEKIDSKFCELCGSYTLIKVSLYINASGELTFYRNPNRKVNLRGTKYALAKPKAGRFKGGVVYKEDELLTGQKAIMAKQKEKQVRVTTRQINDTLNGNFWEGGQGYGKGVTNLLQEGGKGFGIGEGGSGATLIIGKPKGNPNKVKRSTGNKRATK